MLVLVLTQILKERHLNAGLVRANIHGTDIDDGDKKATNLFSPRCYVQSTVNVCIQTKEQGNQSVHICTRQPKGRTLNRSNICQQMLQNNSKH